MENKITLEIESENFIVTKSGRKIPRTVKNSSSNGKRASISDKFSSLSISDGEIQGAKKKIQNKTKKHNKKKIKLIYLDLSTNEVKIVKDSRYPVSNNNENLYEKLLEFKDRETFGITSEIRAKRKLFTARLDEKDNAQEEPLPLTSIENTSLPDDENFVKLSRPLPRMFAPINKQLEAVKTKSRLSKSQSIISKDNSSPVVPASFDTPRNKCGFLKSLETTTVPKIFCHPKALYYRENFQSSKHELVQKLYGIFNEKVFNNQLDVEIVWNKNFVRIPGRCFNRKKSSGERLCYIALSEKFVINTELLLCTLLHELCHAATWIFNGEYGHSAGWKVWAKKANDAFPELPEIGGCQQFDVEYKYTYKCILCESKSNAHSKFKKIEYFRCYYCHGAIEIFLNQKDAGGNIISTPVKGGSSGFAKFVQENFKNYKIPSRKNSDVMKILTNEFVALSDHKKNKY